MKKETAKSGDSYINALAIYGKVIRFSSSPYGQHFRLVDTETGIIWKLDDLIREFEGKDICVTVKLGKHHGKGKTA